MKHFVIVAVLVALVTVLTIFGLNNLGLMPVQASAQALPIDWMWNMQVNAMSFLFALIIVPMLYSLVVFRRKKGDTSDGDHIEGNTPLEITWTILPLFAVLSFAYLGAFTLGESRLVDPQAMEINVIAQQWSFSFEYPEYGFVTEELYLPVDRQVHLNMISRDVIHSFWVPEFRVKQDILPGRVTEYRVNPSKEGTYKTRCAELCGTSHAYMLATVNVISQASFDEWIGERVAEMEAASQTPESRGEAIISQNGCTACHSLDGSPGIAPTWFGLYGEEVELADGTTVTADGEYYEESILDPQAKIVAGYETVIMPQFTFSEEEVEDIIAYLRTLR